ncbi:MAG: hypothetical protein U1F35_03915 [Steroidobacteraceae bacterium]
MRREEIPFRLGLDQPLRHPDHPRPRTRRSSSRRDFITGAATVLVPSMTLSGLLVPRNARASLASDIEASPRRPAVSRMAPARSRSSPSTSPAAAAVVGSNVLIGGKGGQMDFLQYGWVQRTGLPGNMVPNSSATGSFIDSTFGLRFHSDSAYLRGMLSKTGALAQANTHGSVIAARSENDTGNNPYVHVWHLQGWRQRRACSG